MTKFREALAKAMTKEIERYRKLELRRVAGEIRENAGKHPTASQKDAADEIEATWGPDGPTSDSFDALRDGIADELAPGTRAADLREFLASPDVWQRIEDVDLADLIHEQIKEFWEEMTAAIAAELWAEREDLVFGTHDEIYEQLAGDE